MTPLSPAPRIDHLPRRRPGGPSRRPAIRALAAGAALAALVALTGCGGNDDEAPVRRAAGNERSDEKPTVPASPSPTISESPSPSPSPSPSSPEPSPSSSGPLSLRDRLLTAAELPGFNDQYTWTEGRTSKTEPESLAGTCHQFSMLSIGALKVAYRDYEPAEGDNSQASELVADFADEETARRAFEVLESWRTKCDKALAKYDKRQIGELEDVPLEGGPAHWYLLIYGPADERGDESYFDAQGFVLVGKRIAVVRMALVGQDYNYEAGQEPMVTAVQAAAGKLT